MFQVLFIDFMEVSAFDGDDLGEYSYSFDYSDMAVEAHEQQADETDEEDDVDVQASCWWRCLRRACVVC